MDKTENSGVRDMKTKKHWRRKSSNFLSETVQPIFSVYLRLPFQNSYFLLYHQSLSIWKSTILRVIYLDLLESKIMQLSQIYVNKDCHFWLMTCDLNVLKNHLCHPSFTERLLCKVSPNASAFPSKNPRGSNFSIGEKCGCLMIAVVIVPQVLGLLNQECFSSWKFSSAGWLGKLMMLLFCKFCCQHSLPFYWKNNPCKTLILFSWCRKKQSEKHADSLSTPLSMIHQLSSWSVKFHFSIVLKI